MPKRTNLFQEVVGIVHRHLAEGLLVQESEELVDRLDQDQREVDTTIRAMVAGYELVVSVEANARKRKADRTWVEQHVAKHQTLATNLLILVSEAGFTKPALGVAERAGALTVSPETLEEANPDYLIVTRLNSLWAKAAHLTPAKVALMLEEQDGSVTQAPTPAVPEELPIYLEDGAAVGTLREVVRGFLQTNLFLILQQLGIRDISEDQDAIFELAIDDPGKGAGGKGLFVQRDGEDSRPEGGPDEASP